MPVEVTKEMTEAAWQVVKRFPQTSMADALTAALSAAPDPWKTIETAPRDGTWVLVTNDWPEFMPITGLHTPTGVWVSSSLTTITAPTHWMLLPPPPRDVR